jgi:LPS-assembly lipoprotein
MRLRTIFAAAALAALSLLQGCGFTPVYATKQAGERPLLARMHVADIVGNDRLKETISEVLSRRAARDDADALYDITLDLREAAIPLAVQIDDSVTRYNYRMTATYTLVRRSTRKSTTGTAEAIASFNVVASQYSTLYAENAAREKAANALADQIERSIFLKFSAEERAEIEARRAAARR